VCLCLARLIGCWLMNVWACANNETRTSITQRAHALVAERGHLGAQVLHGSALSLFGVDMAARKFGLEHFQEVVARVIAEAVYLLKRSAVIGGYSDVLELERRQVPARADVVEAGGAVELLEATRLCLGLALFDRLDKNTLGPADIAAGSLCRAPLRWTASVMRATRPHSPCSPLTHAVAKHLSHSVFSSAVRASYSARSSSFSSCRHSACSFLYSSNSFSVSLSPAAIGCAKITLRF